MPTLKGGVITRIHVNKHVMRKNKKTGERSPVFTIKHRGKTIYASSVTMAGELVYRPDQPLSCGAEAWVETRQPVVYMP